MGKKKWNSWGKMYEKEEAARAQRKSIFAKLNRRKKLRDRNLFSFSVAKSNSH
jgi:hypothetical protein